MNVPASSQHRPRILFFAHQASYVYGAEICTMELMSALRQEVDIIFCAPTGPFHERAASLADAVHLVPSIEFGVGERWTNPSFTAFVRTHRALMRIIREERIDIVHTIGIRAMAYAWMVGVTRRTRVVWHHHNTDPFSVVRWIYHRVLSAGADSIIVPSEATRRSLMQLGVRKASIERIYNGFTAAHWVPRSAAGNGTFTVGFIGQLSERKGFDTVVEVIRSVAARNVPVRFVIAGDTLYEYQFAERMLATLKPFQEAGMVEVLGYRTDVPELLQGMDLLLVPSRLDPLPTVIIEAALSGVPALGNMADGIPELIVQGETGFLCTSTEEYVERIVQMQKDRAEAQRMGMMAREGAEERFDIRTMARSVREVYATLLR